MTTALITIIADVNHTYPPLAQHCLTTMEITTITINNSTTTFNPSPTPSIYRRQRARHVSFSFLFLSPSCLKRRNGLLASGATMASTFPPRIITNASTK